MHLRAIALLLSHAIVFPWVTSASHGFYHHQDSVGYQDADSSWTRRSHHLLSLGLTFLLYSLSW